MSSSAPTANASVGAVDGPTSKTDAPRSPFPNLAALVGDLTASVLVRLCGGSLGSFCSTSDASVRLAGNVELVTGTQGKAQWLPSALSLSPGLKALAAQLQVGAILSAPILRRCFSLDDDDMLTSVNVSGLRKAIAVLSRKAILAARADLGGAESGDETGRTLHAELEKQFVSLASSASLGDGAKVLSVPEFFQRREEGELSRKRGGAQKRLIQEKIAKRKGIAATATETERMARIHEVRYGTEAQQEALLHGRELRALDLAEARAREQKRKREREEEAAQLQHLGAGAAISGGGEYDDLFAVQL